MQYKVVLEYVPLKNDPATLLTLAAFLLNANEKTNGNGCFVYFGNQTSDHHAVQYCCCETTASEKNRKEIITVQVQEIPETIQKIVFVVAAKDQQHTQESIKQAKETGTCSLFHNNSEYPVHCFDFADTDFEGGVVFYEIVRTSTGWTERVIAEGNKNTLNDFTNLYGIETQTVVLSSPPPPPVPPSPSSFAPPQPPAEKDSPSTQLKLTQLKEENQKLKQQLQLERNRTTRLLEKCNLLIQEKNKLLEQQLKNSDLLSELQMLFLESSQYHFARPPIKNALERSSHELAQVRNLNTLLTMIDDLRGWWNDYRVQNINRSSFWRPDSWSRFENKFPNHPITIKLKDFTK
ncbi:MAG: TerD family protein [Planctomycetaceae bacterium]|jgi:tellurium resistance protein TerD|nr:TerD family protein [Planctomycetaceae bacterium]